MCSRKLSSRLTPVSPRWLDTVVVVVVAVASDVEDVVAAAVVVVGSPGTPFQVKY